MQSKTRLPVAIILACVAVVVVAGVGMYLIVTVPPSALPIRAGTVFMGTNLYEWVGHFTAPASGGRLVGAWDASNATSASVRATLGVASGTVIHPPIPPTCPAQTGPVLVNNTVDQVLSPGPYTLFWVSCDAVATITITQTVELV